ncbi:HAD hydrolase-like protein [Candidatus Woesearchaeota archaeon]|nr:HAD hydrolase-like protein [Candidatus Woesearchaeota archaeon]
MKTLVAFDFDGVLRDESPYRSCMAETVAFFDKGKPATPEELIESMTVTNDDWVGTHTILKQRGIIVDFETVTRYLQDLYLGRDRDFTGRINNEPWLADNDVLAKLSEAHPLVIVSGAPKQEVMYALQRNEAERYFKQIWGKEDYTNRKKDGLEKAITSFQPDRVLFCDDRPAPLRESATINGVRVYGIVPPQKPVGWRDVLMDAGAEKVFQHVTDYCQYVLSGEFLQRKE